MTRHQRTRERRRRVRKALRWHARVKASVARLRTVLPQPAGHRRSAFSCLCRLPDQWCDGHTRPVAA